VKPASGIAIHQQVENLACGALEQVEWSIWKNNKYLLINSMIRIEKSYAY
jgi:hypothetical protein